MTNINYLIGSYNIDKNYLIHRATNLKLLITTRSKTEGKKSVNFLLDKTNNKGGYISSLFPILNHTEINSYNFDYKGIRYILTLNKAEGKAEIQTT